MKILYIGHLHEGTGWSKAALNNVTALIDAGQDVTCRSIKLTNNQNTLPDIVEHSTKKEIKDIDVCIQHVLPHHLVATTLFKKNIAFFEAETSSIKHLSWYYNLRLMDEVWVPCTHNKNVLLNDGIEEDKVKIIPHTFNIEEYKTIQDLKMSIGTQGFFKFYTISDLNDRKNIDSIIRCFHSEFRSYEPVELVLKISSNSVPKDVTQNILAKKIKDVKEKLRIHKDINQYKQDIIISDYLTSEDLKKVHMCCDCFVSPSHGEGFSIPSFEAMLYGKTPICSNDGGPKDFIDPNDKDTGSLVNGVYDVCNTTNAAFPEINTGLEEWFHPSESQIKKSMRYYYENKNNIDRSKGIKQGESFDRKFVVKKIMGLLND